MGSETSLFRLLFIVLNRLNIENVNLPIPEIVERHMEIFEEERRKFLLNLLVV